MGLIWKESTIMNKYKGMKKKSVMLNLFEYYITVSSLGLSFYLIAEVIC